VPEGYRLRLCTRNLRQQIWGTPNEVSAYTFLSCSTPREKIDRRKVVASNNAIQNLYKIESVFFINELSLSIS
jgi:hypothetical protein